MKLEAILSPDGPVLFLWAMKGSRQMTAREIEIGETALKAEAPANARVMSVSWLADEGHA
jgi:hypothetical protein